LNNRKIAPRQGDGGGAAAAVAENKNNGGMAAQAAVTVIQCQIAVIAVKEPRLPYRSFYDPQSSIA
jgi:hypothetical protein